MKTRRSLPDQLIQYRDHNKSRSDHLLVSIVRMEYKEIIQEVIQKNLGDKYISTKKLLDAGLVGVIRAHNLYFTKKRPFKFETYAKHFIKEEVIAKFIGVDRKKAEKYAKLMGYIDAAKGNVKAVLP